MSLSITLIVGLVMCGGIVIVSVIIGIIMAIQEARS